MSRKGAGQSSSGGDTLIIEDPIDTASSSSGGYGYGAMPPVPRDDANKVRDFQLRRFCDGLPECVDNTIPAEWPIGHPVVMWAQGPSKEVPVLSSCLSWGASLGL